MSTEAESRQWRVGNPQALAGESGLWQAVSMAKKRTKADKAQRQANQLEKKADTRSEQTPKKPPRGDFSQAAARIEREGMKD